MANPAVAYRPNLPNLMTLCSSNYALLVRLLADKELAGEDRHFFVSDNLAYVIAIKEVTRYTSLVSMTQLASKKSAPFANLIQPTMQIRLYHDARMAEVLSSQKIRQIKPRYDYPNSQMHLPDEKLQINLFLKEWLQLCIEQGQVKVALN